MESENLREGLLGAILGRKATVGGNRFHHFHPALGPLVDTFKTTGLSRQVSAASRTKLHFPRGLWILEFQNPHSPRRQIKLKMHRLIVECAHGLGAGLINAQYSASTL
jgi:hypothetical protein